MEDFSVIKLKSLCYFIQWPLTMTMLILNCFVKMMKMQLGDKAGFTTEEYDYVEKCKSAMRTVTKKLVK